MLKIAGIIIAFFGLLVCYALYKDHLRKEKKRKRIKDRTPLSKDEIYQQYYSDSEFQKEDVLFLWVNVAKLLSLDYRKLRPTDSFIDELAPVPGEELSDESENVLEFLDFLAKERNIAFDPVRIKTLNDVIQLFAKK
jgi:hypothetical protein